MKAKIPLALALLCSVIAGSYKVGKLSADTYWKSVVVNREEVARREIIEQEIEATHSLYDWNRPLSAGVYIGCRGDYAKVIIKNGYFELDDTVDYGIWLNPCTGEVLEGSDNGWTIKDIYFDAKTKTISGRMAQP